MSFNIKLHQKMIQEVIQKIKDVENHLERTTNQNHRFNLLHEWKELHSQLTKIEFQR